MMTATREDKQSRAADTLHMLGIPHNAAFHALPSDKVEAQIFIWTVGGHDLRALTAVRAALDAPRARRLPAGRPGKGADQKTAATT